MRIPSAIVAIAMLPVMAAAQQFLPAPPGAPVDPNSRYEAAVIRAGENGGQVMLRSTPGHFDATNVPLGLLLRQALQKSDYQIVGIPGWVDTVRFSIRATTPDGAAPLTANRTMLLNLLKDRFQLVTHTEIRELPVFNLVVARADSRLGPDLKATSADCQAIIAERIAADKAAAGRGGPPPLPPLGDPNGPPPCGFQRMGIGLAAGSGRTTSDLASYLADLVGRPVIDRTGLAGKYDFSLKFAPESAGTPGILKLLGTPQGVSPPGADPNAPSLLAAVQEQLGLKFENARGPVEVVVIDRLERPTLD